MLRAVKENCLQAALSLPMEKPCEGIVSAGRWALNSSLMQGSTRRSALQKEELSLAPAERWPQRGARERRAESDAGSTRTERDCRPGRGPTHVDHQAGRGRGRGQPTSLANHCDPRWPCPPHGLASLAMLHCWLRAALDGAHWGCCQTPGVESQLLLPQTFVLWMQFRTCLQRDLGVSFQSEPAEVMDLCGDVCGEAARWASSGSGAEGNRCVALQAQFQTWLPALAEWGRLKGQGGGGKMGLGWLGTLCSRSVSWAASASRADTDLPPPAHPGALDCGSDLLWRRLPCTPKLETSLRSRVCVARFQLKGLCLSLRDPEGAPWMSERSLDGLICRGRGRTGRESLFWKSLSRYLYRSLKERAG